MKNNQNFSSSVKYFLSRIHLVILLLVIFLIFTTTSTVRGQAGSAALSRPGETTTVKFFLPVVEKQSLSYVLLGWNDLGLELYSTSTGGCRDALHVDRVNQNQGAESTLAFLLSLAELQLMQNAVTVFNQPDA